MLTIFDRLVDEMKAWHLFGERTEYPLLWELPGSHHGERGGAPRHRLDLTTAPPPPGTAR